MLGWFVRAPLGQLLPFSRQPPLALSHCLLRRALRCARRPHVSRNVFPSFHQHRQSPQQAKRRRRPRQHVRPHANHGVHIRRQLTHQRHRPTRQRQLQSQAPEAQALHPPIQPPAPAPPHPPPHPPILQPPVPPPTPHPP